MEGRSENDYWKMGYFPIAASPYRIAGKMLLYLVDAETGIIFTPRKDVMRDEYKGSFVIANCIVELLKLGVHMGKKLKILFSAIFYFFKIYI